MKMVAVFALICGGGGLFASQVVTSDQNLLFRRYQEGEKLTYHMKGINENWHYEIQADGIVKKDSAGAYSEEYQWSNLISDNQKVVLPAASVDFRQELTIDPNHNPLFPNLSRVDTKLVGPITDLMTIYIDLWLAKKVGKLEKTGDHFYFKRSNTNSWADGNYTLIGEDSIDFDFILRDVDRADGTATLIVRHVPPEKPEVKIPAEWMRKPVADTANNWVQVQKMQSGKYLAAMGKETFDDEIRLSLADGKILSGTIHNPVVTVERECTDAALTTCGAPRPHPILRQIEISLVR